MLEAPFGLTEKECAVLRLLVRGHDAKSAAATLGLSIHTVNERLREARLKTQTSSSRGAARLLAEAENPKVFGPSEFGVTERPSGIEQSGRLHPGAADGSRFWSRWGASMTASAVVTIVVLASVHIASDAISTRTVPKVVSTLPALNAIVAPGRITLSVTFDRPMRRQSYSIAQKSADTYPDCGSNQPVQSTDGRTFTMKCDVRPGRRYEIWFNSPPYMNFVDENRVSAVPYRLRFQARQASTPDR